MKMTIDYLVEWMTLTDLELQNEITAMHPIDREEFYSLLFLAEKISDKLNIND